MSLQKQDDLTTPNIYNLLNLTLLYLSSNGGPLVSETYDGKER
jgi:hypothetical protein